MMSIPWLPA
jgi:hypothetical protein